MLAETLPALKHFMFKLKRKTEEKGVALMRAQSQFGILGSCYRATQGLPLMLLLAFLRDEWSHNIAALSGASHRLCMNGECLELHDLVGC